MTVDTAHEPLVKTVTVDCGVARAFELFTRDIGKWWPLPTHSVGALQAVDVELQCTVGGQILEHISDGSRHLWGTIRDWCPPDRLSFSWHPGNPESEATDVEVTFRAEGAGTVVTLTHSGWEKRSDSIGMRRSYDSGWDVVLTGYLRSASENSAALGDRA